MSKAIGRRAWTWVDGDWIEGSPNILNPRSHAVWLSSVVFDGARAFDGQAPDLDRHCARVLASAELTGLSPAIDAAAIERLAWDGIDRFPRGMPLYICPMVWAEDGFITPDPETTRFVLSLAESALPQPSGFSACFSSFRRPARDMAPTEAKASCLYPNVARAIREAGQKGFDTAIMRDPSGNVAEFAYMNLFLAQGGAVHTPAPNGTFLNGITRQRVITLLRAAGIEVIERAIDAKEVQDADEVFATGNYSKVQPCTRIERRDLPPGRFYKKARDLYFEYARTCTRP